MAQWVKNLPAMQETQEMQVRSLGRKDPLEKEMETCASILAQKTPWTEEPGGHSPRVRKSDTTRHAGTHFAPGAVVDPRDRGMGDKGTKKSWRQIKRQPAMGRPRRRKQQRHGWGAKRSEGLPLQGGRERLAQDEVKRIDFKLFTPP